MKKTFTSMCVLLLFVLFGLSSFAQNVSSKKNVTGTVTDATGVPLPGVNIVESGTSNGVVSDFDGNYKISVNSNSTLVFTFVGMKTRQVEVKDQAIINVTLDEDTATLDEVVVVGYGAQKRTHVTTSIESINMADIETLPVGDLGTALAGRVLGVHFSGGSTRPGSTVDIRIRNPVTLSKDGGNTSPLYVIDGVIQVDPNNGFNDSTYFNNLDASEVESISFLKDASAAIYGSRAAQGVIIVTTKKGKKGPAKFSYSGNYSIVDETSRTKMMNASQYAQYFDIINGPNGDKRTPGDRNYFFTDNEKEYFKTLNYDQLDDAWSSAVSQRHNMNVTGGSESGNYFAGISYYTQEGNLSTLDYDRWSFRSGANVNLSTGLKADIQVSGYFTDQSKTFNKVSGENDEHDYFTLLNALPFLPAYIAGKPVELTNNNQNLNRYHYSEIERLGDKVINADESINVNIGLEYEIPFIKGLKARATYARTATHNRGNQLGHIYQLYQFSGPNATDTYIYYPSGVGELGENVVTKTTNVKNGDRILISNNTRKNEQQNFNLSYARDFGKHSVSALFAIEKAEASYQMDRLIRDNPAQTSNGQIWTAFGEHDTWTDADETGNLSYIGRVNYGYGEKYFAEFLYRSDASDKFHPKNYWGNFYSLSTGWIISNESFFNSKTIDFLKFRGSIGMLGKDDIKRWLWLQRFTYNVDKGAVFGGNNNVLPGLRMDSAPNSDARWSKEFKTNFGFEARFLDNRLAVTAESFYNIGTDILMEVTKSVPFVVGGTVAAQNHGKVDFWGYEFSIGWNDEIGKDFKYGVDVNIGWSNNKVIQGDFADISTLKPWETRPGKSFDNGTWGFEYEGMFKTQDEITNYIAASGVTEIFGKKAVDFRPGMLYYKDVRGAYLGNGEFAAPDGIIDDNDQIQLAKPSKGPTGFETVIKLEYKQFSLNTAISVGWGGFREIDGSAKKKIPKTKINENYENRPAFWGDIYDPEINPNGKYPNPAFDGNFKRSEFWEVSNFSLGMRNINLSYALPKKHVEKLNLSSFRLNLVGLNPFILYNPYDYKGPNGAYDNYPVLKTYSLGLSVGF